MKNFLSDLFENAMAHPVSVFFMLGGILLLLFSSSKPYEIVGLVLLAFGTGIIVGETTK